ncbi:MAG TPA: hypothetical protein VF469_20200 [Kofleriaceae bacterium]
MERTFRSAVAAITTVGFLTATGCGGATWPNRAVGISTIPFARHQLDVSRIDVLPLDLQVWAENGYKGDLDEVRSAAEGSIMGVALDTLANRNYNAGAVIDWDGTFPGGTALSHDDLLATVGALSRYGAAAAKHPGQLPVPYLPARLGDATGSEATLYIGGWAYVANQHETTGEQIGKAILITLAVVAVVAIVVALLDHHGSSHGSSHGGGHGGGGTSASTTGGGHSFGHGFHHGNLHRTAGLVDAFGRTAVDIALAMPDWQDDPELPHEGDQSQMYLEMTLVDNRTGLALWHAHQTFPAELGHNEDTARAVRTLLALLPSHVSTIAQP